MENYSLIAAYGAGLSSFLAPCLLPLIPSYFSAISGFTFADLYGLNFDRIRRRVFLSALCFAAGFTVFFTLLGFFSTSLTHLIIGRVFLLTRAGGVLLLLLGLVQIGAINIRSWHDDFAWRVQKRLARLGYLTSFLTGILLALVWTPCIGPALAAILLLAAGQETYWRGVGLLFVFSSGLSTPFLLLGLFFPEVFSSLNRHRPALRFVSLLSGFVMIAFSLILIFGFYNEFIVIFRRFFAGI